MPATGIAEIEADGHAVSAAHWWLRTATVAALALAPRAGAQDASVRGTVRAADGRPVPLAEVLVGDSSRTRTDSAGAFFVAGLAAGETELRRAPRGVRAGHDPAAPDGGAAPHVRDRARGDALRARSDRDDVASPGAVRPRRRRARRADRGRGGRRRGLGAARHERGRRGLLDGRPLVRDVHGARALARLPPGAVHRDAAARSWAGAARAARRGGRPAGERAPRRLGLSLDGRRDDPRSRPAAPREPDDARAARGARAGRRA